MKISATKENITSIKEDFYALNSLIADTKSELIKWMFIFWVGQVAVTFGFILLFLKR